MKHKLKSLLKDRSGSTVIIIPFLVLGVLILGTTMWEYSRLNTVAQGSRDAVQTAITQVCTEQYDQLYNGLREGYSGGYKLQSTNWTENVDVINITTKLDAKLGTHNGEKISNGKTEYKITGMSVQLHNAPLAPGNSDDTKQFSGTATYTLTVPLSFGWSSLPPMVVQQKAIAGYSPQGELAAGSGDGSGGDGIPVTGIELSESALTLQKGEYASLSAEVSPDDATDPDVTWTSANDGVATVNRAGLVKGMDAGKTTVLAMSDGRMAQCDVTVVNPVTHVALNKTSLKLNKGASETLVAAVAPDNATDKSLWWTTSNADICTIDADGKVTAVSPGTAEIAVEARSGGAMATCQVTVESPVSGVTLNKTAMTLRPEASEKLTATVTPEDATNSGVMWASSNPEICTVDQDGNVTAVQAGTAVISATAKDNVHMAQCSVTVTIPVTGVTLNKTYLSIIKRASDILYATVWPADATNKAITWSSSNNAICTVDQSGVITATGVGTATITVTTQDGGFTAACTVDVKPNTFVVSANAVHGHVEGTGTYWAGMNVTLTAVPDEHYHFVNWANANGTVIGTNSTYTINNLSADTTLTANFEIDAFTVTVNAGIGGTVTGGGTYAYGTVITLKATANTGYHFVNWSDGNTDPARNYTVTANIVLTANFKSDSTEESLFDIEDHGDGTCAITGFSSVANIPNVIIPSYVQGKKVTSLKGGWFGGVFAFNKNVRTVIISNSVTTIEKLAFSNCDSIQSVNIPNSVTTIGNLAFSGCDSLNSISIPDSVTTIGSSAFNNCKSIASISIPQTIRLIDEYAFSGWTSSQTIYIYGKSNESQADNEWENGALTFRQWRCNVPEGQLLVGSPIAAKIVYCG